MAYKLLALDLDGTLTDSNKKVPERNKVFIRRAQEAGTKVVLASGRPTIGIRALAKELALDEIGGYILAYNGGQIIDCATGEVMEQRLVPKECHHEICEIARRFPVHPMTYVDEGIICENNENRYVLYEGFCNSVPVFKVDSLEEVLPEHVTKFLIAGDPEELPAVENYLKERFGDLLNVFYSESFFLEVTPVGVEKARSLGRLLRMIGMEREEMMACGDGYNDIPMLRYAGLSVVMGNGYEETKKYADVIVGTNNECGVAEAIERFIINGEAVAINTERRLGW